MELTDLYSDRIIEIAGALPETARLEAPDATVRKVSRICGSVIEVDVKMEAGVVSAYAHHVNACALGQTSASVMAREVVGSTPDELRAVRDEMYAMLKDGGPPPGGKWSDLKYLEPVRDYAPRHTSTLLVFDAVAEALDRIEADEAG